MKVVTRFNPTVNGKLHLGHLFTLLVNEYFARSRNGKFYIRFDDDSSVVRAMPVEEVNRIEDSQIEDFDWLGIYPDDMISQKSISYLIQEKLKSLGYEELPEVPLGHHKLPYCVRMGTSYVIFPYVVQQTAERVVMDNMWGVTHVIRGDDFISEYSLYCYFCQKFQFPTPEFIFLPRLVSVFGDISKTNGGYKISDFRECGYSSDQLKRMMGEACLIYPNNGWEIYNIKSNPKINL